MKIDRLLEEFKAYYSQRYLKLWPKDQESPLWDIMDAYANEHPECSICELKAMQYETIAKNFQPVLFRNSPFFFEMGLKFAEARGCPDYGLPASWLTLRHNHKVREKSTKEVDQYHACSKYGIHSAFNFWDHHHHTTNSTNIIKYGLESFYNEAERELGNCKTPQETTFLKCAMRGLLAVKRIAEKFAEAAEARLKIACDPQEQKFLAMIAQAARRVPWKPAETFYEGLAMFPFLYEVIASLEGNGLSAFGRLDYVLGSLYEHDLAAGKITQDEAYDLLCRMLCFTDCRYDKYGSWQESYNSQENGTALTLGGYDENYRPVCNDVTLMILDAHQQLGLIFPKLQIRLTKETPQVLLTAVNRNLLAGRNVLALQNDESIIPAQVKAGKSFADASHYAIGACWETIIEGYEHSAGANCYFNLLKIMDLSIHFAPELENESGTICRKFDACTSFEEVYQTYYANVIQEIRRMCMAIEKFGSLWPDVNPSPFFSACMKDCIKNHKDYTAGGGRYNPHALPLGGFANTIDALLSIKCLCFDREVCTLQELLRAVRADWSGYENLRLQALDGCAYFGDNSDESMELARHLYHDIYRDTRNLKNERGGPFQLAFYMAWEYLSWAEKTNATPDGRKRGDIIANGITPARTHKSLSLGNVFGSVGGLDLSNAPANASLDVMLPLGDLSDEILSAVERSFVASGGMQLQMNCVSKAVLEDAVKHPDKHQDLFVRIFGFSARFVLLPEKWQNEIICRFSYGVSASENI